MREATMKRGEGESKKGGGRKATVWKEPELKLNQPNVHSNMSGEPIRNAESPATQA